MNLGSQFIMLTEEYGYTRVLHIKKFAQQAGIALGQCSLGSLHAFVLFDSILNVHVNNFLVILGRVFLG